MSLWGRTKPEKDLGETERNSLAPLKKVKRRERRMKVETNKRSGAQQCDPATPCVTETTKWQR